MEASLGTKYGSRIAVARLAEALPCAVDEALAARTNGELHQQLSPVAGDSLHNARRANGGPGHA